ncbi:hypothetical protein BDY24DRAFT_407457 [Mrakia frigida]|uniref:uncharacterized protein n=1 Tax=Mrakia frigida TaxID=29902 RepID=UPI003FCBF269
MSDSTPTSRDYPLRTTKDALHLQHLQTCLVLSLECTVSPTAFCVGSTFVLPAPPSPSSSSSSDPEAQGDLLLSTGYSREPPLPTSHAESSALSKLLALPLDDLHSLLASQKPRSWPGSEGWTHQDVLERCDVYTTLEPCSVRTSGEPDCARLLARHRVKRVFVGVNEPPDFVQCLGTRFLEEAGVEVWRVEGLERECLERARRGRD